MISKAYSVQFDINPKSDKESYNVIYMWDGTDMVSSVYFHHTHESSKFSICTKFNKKVHFCNADKVLPPLHAWTTVNITQKQKGSDYIYTAKLNNTVVATYVNSEPEEKYNVHIFYGLHPDQGSTRNFVIIPNTEGKDVEDGIDLSKSKIRLFCKRNALK